MIAPVVIVALISIYYIAIGVIFAYMNGVPMLAKIIALVVPAFSCVRPVNRLFSIGYSRFRSYNK